MSTDTSSIPLSLHATAASFANGWQSVSWSKMTVFRKCQASWFFGNYGVPLERTVYSDDEYAAIPGTITQRIWETVINDHAPLHQKDDAQLSLWMKQQARALWHAIAMPYEAQFNRSREEWRKFFRSVAGRQHLEWVTAQHGLSPSFYKGIQPKFLNVDKFLDAQRVKNLDDYFDKLHLRFSSMLAKFRAMNLDWTQFLSEKFIRAEFNGHKLGGGVDFLYNTTPTFQKNSFGKNTNQTLPLVELKQLNDGYLMLDGKNQIGGHVDIGQLFFYALIIHLQYRRLPRMVGFIDWSKSDFVWYNFDLSQIEQMKRSVMAMQATAYRINEALQHVATRELGNPQASISVYDVPHLKFTPSRIACRFCGMRDRCSKAYEAGTNVQPPKQDYIDPKALPFGLTAEDMKKNEVEL